MSNNNIRPIYTCMEATNYRPRNHNAQIIIGLETHNVLIVIGLETHYALIMHLYFADLNRA